MGGGGGDYDVIGGKDSPQDKLAQDNNPIGDSLPLPQSSLVKCKMDFDPSLGSSKDKQSQMRAALFVDQDIVVPSGDLQGAQEVIKPSQ